MSIAIEVLIASITEKAAHVLKSKERLLDISSLKPYHNQKIDILNEFKNYTKNKQDHDTLCELLTQLER